jgi:hypothetical protein
MTSLHDTVRDANGLESLVLRAAACRSGPNQHHVATTAMDKIIAVRVIALSHYTPESIPVPSRAQRTGGPAAAF